jgi:hypothetical protein
MVSMFGSEQSSVREKVEAIVTAIGQLDAKAAADVPQLEKIIRSLAQAGRQFKHYYDPYAVAVIPDPGEWRERSVKRGDAAAKKKKKTAKRVAKTAKAGRSAGRR